MPVNIESFQRIKQELESYQVSLLAVSKTKAVEEIRELYDLGQRIFGENYVQEIAEKQASLPHDISWHFIGHLQSNKVKFISPFVSLIHSVDSFKLLTEINKQAAKNNKVIDCLLQIHIAMEETKFGLNEAELEELLNNKELNALDHIKIKGLMGMASFTEDIEKIRQEYKYLKSLFVKFESIPVSNCKMVILSMGMSSDYKIALEEGSNLVRIGSLLFGKRNSNQ